MKKGYRGCGIVDHVEFPNKGIVITEDGERVIVKNSIPGQKVEFAVNKIKHKKAEGRLMQVIEKSELETEKACPHFGACGGCTYQTVPYEKQLDMKLSQVKKLIVDAIGTEDDAGYKFLGIIGSPQNKEYRNKMEFSFGDEYKDGPLALGMHKRGMKLFTTGTITIDGVVEASDIECKKDVLIRGGVHGGYESKIKTDGSFFAGFMEYASVESKGQIIAESILNCDVMCYDRILVANKNASIVGGKVYATAGIEVNILGNKNYVKTKIDAGLQANVVQEVVTLQSRVFEDQNTVKKTEKILKTLADKEYKDPHQNNKNPIKIDLLRTKVTKQAQIVRDNARLEELNIILKKASDATIRINQEIYPGVDVAINNIRTKVSSHQKAVEFTECEKKLRMYSLEIR